MAVQWHPKYCGSPMEVVVAAAAHIHYLVTKIVCPRQWWHIGAL